MKKILTFALITLGYGFTFASWQCRDFSAGEICLDLKNNGNGNYSVKKQFTKKVDKYTIELSCKILTPDGYLKDMGICDGNFNYNKKGSYNIDYYVSLEGETKIIHGSYYFDPNGQIDNSASTLVVDKSNTTSSSSNTNNSNTSTSNTSSETVVSSQLQTIRDVYNMWGKLIDSLGKKYPQLLRNGEWVRYSTYVYSQMDNYLKGNTSDIKSYTDFRVMLTNFVRMTKNYR